MRYFGVGRLGEKVGIWEIGQLIKLLLGWDMKMRMVLIDFAGKLGWQVLAYPNTCIESQISMTKVEFRY